jgi:hypothetical protein
MHQASSAKMGGLAIAVVVLFGMFNAVPVAIAHAPHRGGKPWCGNSSSTDWACARHGVSWLGSVALSTRRPQRMWRHDLIVATAEGGSARVSLRNEAQCTVGTGRLASKAVARPESGVLLRQLSGDTSCATPTHTDLELCTKSGCNVQLETEGVMLSSIFSEEATASDYTHEEVVHHRLRIVSCSGFVSVQSPGGSASGRATPPNRYVIEIDDYSWSRESETTTETTTTESADGTIEKTVTTQGEASAGSGSEIVQSVEVPGRGPCRAKYVREEERGLRS